MIGILLQTQILMTSPSAMTCLGGRLDMLDMLGIMRKVMLIVPPRFLNSPFET